MKIGSYKFSIGEIVSVDKVIYKVADIIAKRDYPHTWFYDLREYYGDGEKLNVPECDIDDVKKEGDKFVSVKDDSKKTFTVHYSFYLSESVDIEARSEEEARNICQKMIDDGEIGNLNEMEIGDSNVWVD